LPTGLGVYTGVAAVSATAVAAVTTVISLVAYSTKRVLAAYERVSVQSPSSASVTRSSNVCRTVLLLPLVPCAAAAAAVVRVLLPLGSVLIVGSGV
jgi:hypothetical protein